ncbi:hypothetical protein K438DRAFT_1989012 [Mycena galopus ATCC 62051]|nr:hypothetical protein K438DRAFT_1989012 [Mycena galopus ATCC 62051]
MAALPPLGAAAATKPVWWPCHPSITIDGSTPPRPVDSYRGVAVLSSGKQLLHPPSRSLRPPKPSDASKASPSPSQTSTSFDWAVGKECGPARLPEPSAASNASPSLFQTSTSLDLALRKKNVTAFLSALEIRETVRAVRCLGCVAVAVSSVDLPWFQPSATKATAFESALEICEAAGAVCCLRRVAVTALNVDLSTEEMVPAAVRHLYDVAVAVTNTDDSSITILTLRTPR